MNEFMVAWNNGSRIELKTREAALHLKNSFLEEGREAQAYGRMSPSSEWMELA